MYATAVALEHLDIEGFSMSRAWLASIVICTGALSQIRSTASAQIPEARVQSIAFETPIQVAGDHQSLALAQGAARAGWITIGQ
jgi:hypothetical protein